jgi:hypothetical protein
MLENKDCLDFLKTLRIIQCKEGRKSDKRD